MIADREESEEFGGDKSIRGGIICVEEILFIGNSASSRALVLTDRIEVATTTCGVIHQSWTRNSVIEDA